jgi:hypothetical protein
MVFPIFGLMAMATTLGAAAMNAGAAVSAPRPPGEKDIRSRNDSRIGQATGAAQKAGMASSLSLARSGSGTGGSRASAQRAAMMQAPEVQARATEAGFNAGSNVAGNEIQSQQIAHGQETDRHFRPYEEVTRGLGALATGASDMQVGQLMTGPGQRYVQSDEHSKQEIKRLSDENASLNLAWRIAMQKSGETAPGSDPDLRRLGMTPQAPAQVAMAGMQRPRQAQPEVIDLDAVPDVAPADPRAAARAMSIQKDQERASVRQASQPPVEYGSDAYFLQNYDPDILEFNKKQQAASAVPKAPVQRRTAKKKGTK